MVIRVVPRSYLQGNQVMVIRVVPRSYLQGNQVMVIKVMGGEIWALFQYPIRCLIIRSCKVSKPRDWQFKLLHPFEIWQALRQPCYRGACQISEQSDNSKYKSRGFEALRDLTVRHLIGYWNVAKVVSSLKNLILIRFKDIAFYVQKDITHRAVWYNFPLVRHAPLGPGHPHLWDSSVGRKVHIHKCYRSLDTISIMASCPKQNSEKEQLTLYMLNFSEGT